MYQCLKISPQHFFSIELAFGDHLFAEFNFIIIIAIVFREFIPDLHCFFNVFLAKDPACPMKDLGYLVGLNRINYRFFLYS